MSGSSSSDQPPVYGTKGVAAPGNVPGARSGASSWIDKDDNLWLFGGSDRVGFLNDLWEFNSATRQWTWVTGRSAAVYGSLRIPADGNTPGARNPAASWTDRDGNFWLFGGYGIDSVGESGPLNDLWMFTQSTGQWTWMGGLNTIPLTQITYPTTDWVWGAPGVYGTLGIPAPGNSPGSRVASSSWFDRKGHFWMFGGNGLDANGNTSDLNDLWEFDPATIEWTWMGGSNTLTCVVEYPFHLQKIVCSLPDGVADKLGVPAVENIPGGTSSATAWSGADGTFWLFGAGDGFSNRLWEFDPATNLWTWMGGGSLGGNCGTLGIPAAGNLPGARRSASGWTDAKGNLWLFGGLGDDCAETPGLLNDVWEYQPTLPASFPTAVPVTFSPVPGTYTSVQSVVLSDATQGGWICYTTDGVTKPDTGSPRYRSPITVGSTQTIQAMAVVPNYLNSEVASAKYIINLPVADTPTFSPPAGTYSSVQSVVLSDATPGTAIYYTTDGTTPTAKSLVYSNPLSVSASETIHAIARASGFADSAVASAKYIINIPPPDFSISISPGSLTLQSGESGTTTVTTTNVNGFHAALSFACSGLPVGYSCTFAPQADSANSDLSHTTLTVTTPARAALLGLTGGSLVPAAALGLAFGLAGRKRRRMLHATMRLWISVVILILITGCGGGKREPSTVVVTVTASSQSLQHSTTLLLTVN